MLQDYKDSLSQNVLLLTTDVECTGFSDSIVEHCEYIFTLGYIMENSKIPVFNTDHGKEILHIISEIFEDIEDKPPDCPGPEYEDTEKPFDYEFSNYFDEGLVLGLVDEIDHVEEYDSEED